jgi:hypothetical protein
MKTPSQLRQSRHPTLSPPNSSDEATATAINILAITKLLTTGAQLHFRLDPVANFDQSDSVLTPLELPSRLFLTARAIQGLTTSNQSYHRSSVST